MIFFFCPDFFVRMEKENVHAENSNWSELALEIGGRIQQ